MNTDKQLLKEAVSEIRELRHLNQIMSLRLRMFDDMMTIFNTRSEFPHDGNSPDILYKIEKHLGDQDEIFSELEVSEG